MYSSDITKSKLFMSASHDNEQIRRSSDKLTSSSASSSSSSFERRKSDPDAKPKSSNPTPGVTKSNSLDIPLSTDRRRSKEGKKVMGFGKGGSDGDDDESNTSPESGTPEEIDEEESDMKRWVELYCWCFSLFAINYDDYVLLLHLLQLSYALVTLSTDVCIIRNNSDFILCSLKE